MTHLNSEVISRSLYARERGSRWYGEEEVADNCGHLGISDGLKKVVTLILGQLTSISTDLVMTLLQILGRTTMLSYLSSCKQND